MNPLIVLIIVLASTAAVTLLVFISLHFGIMWGLLVLLEYIEAAILGGLILND